MKLKFLTIMLCLFACYSDYNCNPTQKCKNSGHKTLVNKKQFKSSKIKCKYLKIAKKVVKNKNLLCKDYKNCINVSKNLFSRIDVAEFLSKIENAYIRKSKEKKLQPKPFVHAIKDIIENNKGLSKDIFSLISSYINWYVTVNNFLTQAISYARNTNFNYIKEIIYLFNAVINDIYANSKKLNSKYLYGFYNANKNSKIFNLNNLNKNKIKILLSPNPLILSESFSNIYNKAKSFDKDKNNIVFFYIDNTKPNNCFGMKLNNYSTIVKSFLLRPYSLFEIIEEDSIDNEHLRAESILEDKSNIKITDKINFKILKLSCIKNKKIYFKNKKYELIVSINDILDKL